MSIKKYIVIDDSNAEYHVTCDEWKLSSSGLVFYIKGKKVYHFLRWKTYYLLPQYIQELQE